MASTAWFDENGGRAYPFIRETVNRVEGGPATIRQLPNDLIVDAGFGPREHITVTDGGPVLEAS